MGRQAPVMVRLQAVRAGAGVWAGRCLQAPPGPGCLDNKVVHLSLTTGVSRKRGMGRIPRSHVPGGLAALGRVRMRFSKRNRPSTVSAARFSVPHLRGGPHAPLSAPPSGVLLSHHGCFYLVLSPTSPHARHPGWLLASSMTPVMSGCMSVRVPPTPVSRSSKSIQPSAVGGHGGPPVGSRAGQKPGTTWGPSDLGLASEEKAACLLGLSPYPVGADTLPRWITGLSSIVGHLASGLANCMV